MKEYKSYRIINGKAIWVVVNENGDIIDKNPDKEKLAYIKVSKLKGPGYSKSGIYNETNTCGICGINFNNAPGNPCRDRDKTGIPTGKWLCNNCRNKDFQKNDPNSQHNVIKSLADRRTCNQDPNSSNAKGDLYQRLTVKWKGVEDLNVLSNNYISPIDHSPDKEGKIYQTKGKIYDSVNKYWHISVINEHNAIIKGFEFTHLIVYCVSKDGRIIERIYIFPIEEVIKRTSITIYKNPSKGFWYEKYRVKDKDILKIVNDLWKEIKLLDD